VPVSRSVSDSYKLSRRPSLQFAAEVHDRLSQYVQGGLNMAPDFVRFNFVKYQPTFRILLLPESKKIVTTLLLKIPPHVKCVAALPCEMSVL